MLVAENCVFEILMTQVPNIKTIEKTLWDIIHFIKIIDLVDQLVFEKVDVVGDYRI